ncbi:MAG: FtsX-like permease family protein, partial [Proteobacteria bacterium]|nr:FtsX-like permease family protein [Pseudomonadota bacterium]
MSHDRSVGTQLLGVAPSGEQVLSGIPDMIQKGRYLNGGAEAFAGALLARNLGVTVGDEIVILGTAPSGGVAALVVTLVGTFSSGIADVDRGLLEVPLDTVSEAFELNDAAHAIVARATSVEGARAVAATLRKEVDRDDVVLEWNELIPGLEQAIELDRIFGQILFAMVAAIVTISVFNGFVMTVFERMREFGALLAIGMRPPTLIGLLQMEAGCLSVIGCAAGLAIGIPLVLWLEQVGIPLGDAGEMMRAFHMADRMYPMLNADVVLKPI